MSPSFVVNSLKFRNFSAGCPLLCVSLRNTIFSAVFLLSKKWAQGLLGRDCLYRYQAVRQKCC